MANVQNIHIFVILLILIAFLEIQFTQGIRELKTGQKIHAQENPNNNHHVHELSSSSDESHSSTDFRPTTPGNSPGIGHSFEGQKDETEQKQDFSNVTGSTDDFRPTGPGHSPGIGHSLEDVVNKVHA
ncbi:hypothetical protein BUALT_Bualt16G0034400 [Buddleja alternifolia]|uniref:Uncharacterized protein n=1 Tax=Buddleja alternifolia TaxID=168488 RepID=A0AAV6WE50_9LAMI|nr:hypothetical protein BUALT_Bualt16G0034400 [Buddleja alternifolia]